MADMPERSWELVRPGSGRSETYPLHRDRQGAFQLLSAHRFPGRCALEMRRAWREAAAKRLQTAPLFFPSFLASCPWRFCNAPYSHALAIPLALDGLG